MKVKNIIMQKIPNIIFGNESEKLAINFLIKNNFEIIKQNFYAKKYGEIDIIAKKNSIFHFIEVKSSKNIFYSGAYNLTSKKLNKIINSVNFYIQINNINSLFQIDAIIIFQQKINFIQNITI